MYQNLKTLSHQTDADTRVVLENQWHFAASLESVTLASHEIEEAAKEFAVVFTLDTPSQPIALLGSNGKNNYVDADGRWMAKHIPTRLAAYPFDAVEHEGQVLIVRAANAPHFQNPNGQPLYEENGSVGPLLEQVTGLVGYAYNGTVAAKHLTTLLDLAGVLSPAHLNVTMSDGTVRGINGFKAINEAALSMISEQTRAQLESTGAMAMLMAHRASLTNLGRILAAPAAAAAPAPKAKRAAKPAAAKAEAKPAAAKAETKPAAAKPAASKAAAKPAADKVAAKPAAVKAAAKPAASKAPAKKAAATPAKAK